MSRLRISKNHIEAAALAFTIYSNYTQIKDRAVAWHQGRGYTVTLVATDAAYSIVSAAILAALPDVDHNQVSMSTRRKDSGDLKVSEGYVASKARKINLEGHEIKVSLEESEVESKSDDISSFMASMKPDKLKFWSPTLAGKHAISRFIQQAIESHDSAPKLMVAARWGSWIDQSDVPPRSMATVVLADNQGDEILDDVKRFLGQEKAYSDMGLPWHRGYLLHGCPGSGKTSLVRALASELGLDLYAITLGSVRDDQTLMNLFQEVQPRSALLLEDIDTAVVARERDEQAEGVSTSGLLNALDGVGTPHGMITFMTTNRREALDDALLRPGRCDRQFHLDYLTDAQLAEMVEVFTGQVVKLPPVPAELSPSVVIEIYKSTLDTPGDFIPLLEKRLSEGT